MMTFHAIVRGFTGEFDWIQRNAIGSWLRLEPTPEVLLFGDDEPGAREFAAEVGSPIYPLKRDHRNIPLVNWPIKQARELAHNEIRCLINADIILFDNFPRLVRIVADKFEKFLLIVGRYDVDVRERIDFSPDWQKQIIRLPAHYKGPLAVDVFCYRGDFWSDMPDFAVGRTSWDNWLVGTALRKRIPVVDGSELAICHHQVHYKKRQIEETLDNRALLGDVPVAGFANVTWRVNRVGKLERVIK